MSFYIYMYTQRQRETLRIISTLHLTFHAPWKCTCWQLTIWDTKAGRELVSLRTNIETHWFSILSQPFGSLRIASGMGYRMSHPYHKNT